MRLQEIIDQRIEERAEDVINQRVEENKMLWFAQGSAQGFDKGMTQGFDRGSRDTKIATARSFLAMGLSAQQVAQGTGLTLEEVETLR